LAPADAGPGGHPASLPPASATTAIQEKPMITLLTYLAYLAITITLTI